MPTKMTSMIFCVVLVSWVASTSGHANAQAAELPLPPDRSEPHEALAFYEGTWTVVDKGNEGYRETCTWLDVARRHIVCKALDQTAEGLRESLGVYSYDTTNDEYVYHGFRSSGSIETERGPRIPNGFQFMSDHGTGGDRVQTRFTIVEGAEGRVKTVSETSKAGGPWVVDKNYEYLRTRP